MRYRFTNKLFVWGVFTWVMTACQTPINKQIGNWNINSENSTLVVWSEMPAFTKVFSNQNEWDVTSDVYDGIWEGEAEPSLPRVVKSSAPPQYIFKEEGKDLQDEETIALTDGKYTNPTRIWEGEPYPIGNGRMAASVFHGSGRDRYALNEVSFWSGGENKGVINKWGDKRYDTDGPDVGTDGFGSYQPVGDLIVDFGKPVLKGSFVRRLDLGEGIVCAQGVREGVTVSSTAFCSHPDQVMVLHYESDKRDGLDVSISFATQRENDSVSLKENEMILDSRLVNGIHCLTKAVLLNKGGDIGVDGNRLRVSRASSLTIILSIETNYVMDYFRHWIGEDSEDKVNKRMEAVALYSYSALLQRHVEDYQHLFGRLTLDITPSPLPQDTLSTAERLTAYRFHPDDSGMEELVFNFGRYLMIATSRGDALPGGLQGIWNGMVSAPWGNDYHSNINFQMVYWLPEVGNLSESHLSMINYLCAMRNANRRATKEYLEARHPQGNGYPEGWVVYTSHNPFGGNGWQVNLPGSAWYALHIWEHFAFSQDTCYLREKAYPMMKEICNYWENHLKTLGKGGIGFESEYKQVDLTEYPELRSIKEGTLVVPNGWSPEHGPRGEDGVAHDQEIVSELFLNTIEAARILRVDSAWVDQLRQKQQCLYPPQIGKKCNLMEWMIDRNPETDHRHSSHLFAVFPGSTVSMEKTPELAEAARKSLMYRKNAGNSRRSWAWTWRAMLWARLKDGQKAHEMVEGLITYNMLDNLFTTHHIPLQIDGNYGIAAAMIEMLVQSHSGLIQLLPAPVDKWPSGTVTGIRARGNITVDMSWKDGRITHWALYSPHLQEVKVKVNGVDKIVQTQIRK